MMQEWAPDWLWDWYCWRRKSADVREAWGNFRTYRRLRRQARALFWDGKS